MRIRTRPKVSARRSQADLLDVRPSFRPSRVEVPTAESDEWYTPQRHFRLWDAEFGFTLDVCATRESAKCERFFTKAQDGLAQSWRGARVFCNPPYSLIAPWLEKALFEVECNGCPLVVNLLPVWSDRRWWHQFVVPYIGRLVELRWIAGRIRFGYPGNPEGLGNHGGGFDPSVLVIWRSSA